MAVMEQAEIQALLPHRYPFLLVDRVLELEPDRRIVGIKNVTVNEPFFQGHFPGRPVMPGVLIVEAMAQVGGLLAFKSLGPAAKPLVYLTGIDGAKFRKPVVPGDRLRIEIDVLKKRPPFWKMLGQSLRGVRGRLRSGSHRHGVGRQKRRWRSIGHVTGVEKGWEERRPVADVSSLGGGPAWRFIHKPLSIPRPRSPMT